MTESIEHPPQAGGSAPPGEEPLALRIERLRALRSAFAALAPSALNDEGRALSHAGRELTRSLTEAQRAPSPLAPSGLARLDEDLERFFELQRFGCLLFTRRRYRLGRGFLVGITPQALVQALSPQLVEVALK